MRPIFSALQKVGTEKKADAVVCKNALKSRIQDFDCEINVHHLLVAT